MRHMSMKVNALFAGMVRKGFVFRPLLILRGFKALSLEYS